MWMQQNNCTRNKSQIGDNDTNDVRSEKTIRTRRAFIYGSHNVRKKISDGTKYIIIAGFIENIDLVGHYETFNTPTSVLATCFTT